MITHNTFFHTVAIVIALAIAGKTSACPWYILNGGTRTNFTSIVGSIAATNTTVNTVVVCDGAVIGQSEYIAPLTRNINFVGEVTASGIEAYVHAYSSANSSVDRVFEIDGVLGTRVTFTNIRFVFGNNTLFDIKGSARAILVNIHILLGYQGIRIRSDNDLSTLLVGQTVLFQSLSYGISLRRGKLTCQYCEFDQMRVVALAMSDPDLTRISVKYIRFLDVAKKISIQTIEGMDQAVSEIALSDDYVITNSMSNGHTYTENCGVPIQSQSPALNVVGGGSGTNGNGKCNCEKDCGCHKKIDGGSWQMKFFQALLIIIGALAVIIMAMRTTSANRINNGRMMPPPRLYSSGSSNNT